jgi:uncharacterized protein
MPSIYLPISLATVAAAALINLWLSMRIAQIRRGKKLYHGDGGDSQLAARMRAQANFIEYTPIVLILLVLVEFAKGQPLWLELVASLYILGRVLHPFGMDGWLPGRMAGAILSMLVTLGLGLYAASLAFTMGNPLH